MEPSEELELILLLLVPTTGRTFAQKNDPNDPKNIEKGKQLIQAIIEARGGASYLGFIFARAEREAAVEASLRAAHARLQFAIDPEFPVLESSQIQYNRRHG